MDHLRVERSASPHTLAAYQNDLKILAELLVSLDVEKWENVQNEHLAKFEASLGKGVKRSTAQRRLSSLRSFFKYLARNGVEIDADLPDTGGFRTAKRLPKALSPVQLSDLMEQQPISTPEGLRDRALFELIYGAGLRISEAVDLEFSDLDLTGFTVRVFGKRGKTRLNPLPEGTVDWLRAYQELGRPRLLKTPLKFFIVSDTGKKLLRQTAYKLIQKYCKLANLPEGISPHTLRHTFAVDMLKAGADLRVVQELLGHESIATTQIYTQLDLAEVRKRYDKAHPRR
jgi:site-specific recombinase XerD